jgi:outer membrane protein OmpA-like peptidoglycan-associated protein
MGEFKIRNLGTVVNTQYLEYAPTITADGKTLFFVSDRPGGVGGHDFWYTTKAGRLDTVFADPVNLGRPINTPLNEGVASIAADGQTIFFTACNREDGLGDCDIYEAELDGSQWINVRNVSEINSPEWDSQPSISSDGKTLYFVSNRPGALGGIGDADIYISTKQSDGKWSAPRNLGAPINTGEREDSPFILPGGKVLYFSSAGHGGLGGLDFFSATLKSDGAWGTPENLGEPFNTGKDERFITLPAAGDIVYFASERTDKGNSGLLDIFMGILPPKTVTVLIKGRVYDLCTNNNLPSEVYFVDAKKGDTLYTAKTTTSKGDYSFVINAEGAMVMNVIGNSPGYKAIADTIGVPETKVYMEITKDFPLGQQPTIGASYEISDFVKDLQKQKAEGSAIDEKFLNFRGLLIEENLVKELYPLLTYVFFDSGSATIPDRYILFTDPSQTEGFDDSKIPGGTLQKYYHMLNIVGYRMRTHPETKIEIVGNNSQQPEIGETKDVSGKRGQVVYDYLINIWKIDPGRIKLLPPRDYPEARSNPKDPLGIVENRRTEIRSTDWEVVKPIIQTELRRYPQPDTMHFQMQNGINNDLVARRAIEIKRNDQMWYVMTNVGKTDPVSPAYEWGKNDDKDSIPNNENPYSAQLVVYSVDGKECRSNVIQIPVMIVTNEMKIRERFVNKTIDRYSLVLFKFDSPDAGPLNDRIIKEFIVDDLRKGAQIVVTGYTDVVGLDDRNLKLSNDRAMTVVNAIKRLAKPGIVASLEGKGVGETAPLYSNDLPEGRFYNRTVQVIVTTPTSQGNP